MYPGICVFESTVFGAATVVICLHGVSDWLKAIQFIVVTSYCFLLLLLIAKMIHPVSHLKTKINE